MAARAFVFSLVFLFALIGHSLALPSCGNGILDTGETCDRQLETCCNSSCTGTYDVAYFQLAESTCHNGPENYVQLSPFIADPTLQFEWIFLTTPAESSPIIYTPTLQSTYLHFDSNGYYVLVMRVTTEFCGTYYSNEFSFTIDDCCGNGVLDNAEQCDYAIEDNGCCDREWCSFVPEGYVCYGDINDQCTHSTTCDGAGACVSSENLPFTVTPQQAQSVYDSACAMDVRQFNFQATFADTDDTPGKYSWRVTIIEATPPLVHSIINAQGLVDGPSGSVTFGVKMAGTGHVYARLDIEDACGLVVSEYYNVTRNCCGNHVLNTGEACDDGNTLNGDYCSSDCSMVTGYCGDSIAQTNEMCDYKLSACCANTCQSILAADTSCRVSRGDCDLPEFCTGITAECPDDTFKPPNTTCRSALGVCDAPETCSGHDPVCPNQNIPFPNTVMCREPVGVCDLPTYCDGLSYGCPTTPYRNSTCRLAQNMCDVEERCQFGNANCPTDVFAPANKTCIIDGSSCLDGILKCAGDTPTCSLTGLPASCPEPGEYPPTPINLSSCIVSVCLEDGACTYDNVGGTCFINGECFERNETSPYNPCAYCNPDTNPNDWSSHIDGYHCLTTNAVDACSAEFDMCVEGVCIDVYKEEGAVCRTEAGLCDVAETCTGDSDLCPVDLFADAETVCHSSTGPCDLVDTCTGSGPTCPSDRVMPNTTVCRARAGPCDIPEMCDGVHKTCPPDAFKDSREICRESNGPCDKQETCSGTSAQCPDDEHYGSEMICRQAASTCDIEERCTGTGINCPPDVYADVSFVCRQAADACDRPEYCTGSSIYCPLDSLYPAGTPCRESQGSCDIPEYCSGSSKQCPTDKVRSSGTVCRRAVGPCDKEEKCDGNTPECPVDAVRGPTFICRSSVGTCDPPEYCIFGNASCPADRYYMSNVSCRAPVGLCDAEEFCPGDGPRCPPDLKVPVGTVCRASVGVCDKPEVCSGVHNRCPQNRFEPTTTLCREATSPCNPADFCSGYSTECPADVFAPTTTVCRAPAGVCDRPEYCLSNGTCPVDLYYDSETMCHLQQSQCDYSAFCTGNSSVCDYDTNEIIASYCDATGLECTTDLCVDVNDCESIGTECGCTMDAQCSTTQECLVGHCVNYACQQTPVANTCFIDGQCYAANQQNPLNLCQVCKPSLSTGMWMPMASGTHCDTGNIEGDCSAQDTCNANGVCIDRFRTGQTCRASAGDCDVKEVCVDGQDWCPEDVYRPSTYQCRAQDGACDAPEFCTGTLPYCPDDGFYPSCYMCRESKGVCDAPEYCTGETRKCPLDIMEPAGTICRDIVGDCDVAETCDGESVGCPSDKLRPDGWVCRPGIGLCDRPETCNGQVHSCPADQLFPEGTVCRYADDPCDEPETCSGTSTACPRDLFSPVTKICRQSIGPCDKTEYCTNTSKLCPTDLVSPQGVVCRQALDVCDKTEVCDGTSKKCPTDQYAPSTQVCRAAVNKCDIEDHCTGTSVRCPVDNKRPNGYSCGDGDFCNGDEYCQYGICTPATAYRNCTRPNPCSLDTCDELSERCIHTSNTGVGQACYSGPNGTLGVGICKAGVYSCDGTGALVCNGQVTPKPFDFCGNLRDDDCNGQTDEGCHVGPCTTDEECVNSPIDTCHLGHCGNNSVCVYHLLPNFCFINDNCYTFNEYKPHNPCQRCYPNASKHEWTQTNQANVSDNNICNGGEYCHDGKVYVDPKPLKCSHLNSPCTQGVCDPASGCYREYSPNESPCHVPGSTCTVQFVCREGMCVCDGVIHSESTNIGLIVALSVGLPLIALLLIFIGFVTWWQERATTSYQKLK